MIKLNDKFYYYILFNIFLIFAINPYISPFVLKGNDLQLPVFILAFLIFSLDFVRKDLYISKSGFLILFFSIVSLIYILPSSFTVYDIRGQLNFLLGFFVFYTFYKYKELIDIRFFNFAVFINIFGILWHYFFTISFLSVANLITRKIKIEEFEGRGPSGFAAEPLYAAAMCFFICIFSKYLLKQKKISRTNDILIQVFSFSAILLTKSGTGYIFILFLFFFIYFGLTFRSLIYKIIFSLILISILTYVSSRINLDNRGINLISDLIFAPKEFICDISLSTRLISLSWGFNSLFTTPFGNGVGSTNYISATIDTIKNNYFFINYLTYCDFSEYNDVISQGYTEIEKLIYNQEYTSYMTTLDIILVDITSYIFMSNFGIYIYEYGIFFILFIVLLFFVNIDKKYVNYAYILGAILSVSTSLSLAFPGFWLLICFANKERNI